MLLRRITPEERAELLRIVPTDAFVHAVCAAVNSYLQERARELTLQKVAPPGKRREQLRDLSAQLRRARASERKLSAAARSTLYVADQAEGGDGDVARALARLLAAVDRAEGIDRPQRGQQPNNSVHGLRFHLRIALEQAGVPAEDSGALESTVRAALAMIGDAAPDVRTVLRNE